MPPIDPRAQTDPGNPASWLREWGSTMVFVVAAVAGLFSVHSNITDSIYALQQRVGLHEQRSGAHHDRGPERERAETRRATLEMRIVALEVVADAMSERVKELERIIARRRRH